MTPRQHQHVTIFEMLELIVAIVLARWIAYKFSSHFDAAWQRTVFWAVAIVGTVVFFLCLLLGVSRLFQFLDRRKTSTTSCDSNKPDAP